MGENPESAQGEVAVGRGEAGEPVGGLEARLDRWLDPTVLRLLALAAVIAAVVIVVAVAVFAEVFTAGWGAAVVGSLTLAASLFSAAAATASVQAGRRSAAASADSARAGARSAEAGVSSADAARRAYGQQLYELARATHRDLTTGEVAAARDLLGTVGRRRKAFWPPEVQVDEVEALALGEWLRSRGYASAEEQLEDTRRAWFTLLWCFQRILAARRLLTRAEAQAPAGTALGGESPRLFLDDLVRNQVRFLNQELSHARAAIEEFFTEPLDDRDSAAAFRELVEVLLEGEKDTEGNDVVPGRWSLPVATHAGEVLRVLLLDSGPRSVLPEDVEPSQYQALECHLYRPNEPGLFADERQGLARRLRARRNELERPGGPERVAISKTPRAGGELDMWASTYADLAHQPVPRTWTTP